MAIETEHAKLVHALIKAPESILPTLTSRKVDLIHAVLGISGEAGELLDAVKKFAIYNKTLDIENVVEELGDLEFYMEHLRQRLGIRREVTLRHNIDKLRKRYPEGYTDAAAHARADKQADVLSCSHTEVEFDMSHSGRPKCAGCGSWLDGPDVTKHV